MVVPIRLANSTWRGVLTRRPAGEDRVLMGMGLLRKLPRAPFALRRGCGDEGGSRSLGAWPWKYAVHGKAERSREGRRGGGYENTRAVRIYQKQNHRCHSERTGPQTLLSLGVGREESAVALPPAPWSRIEGAGADFSPRTIGSKITAASAPEAHDQPNTLGPLCPPW